MKDRSTAAWVAALVLTALVVGAGTWFVTDRSRPVPVGGPVASVDEPTTTTPPTSPSWLFSATAAGGTYRTNADGTSTLTLTDVDPTVTGFTDRPVRDTVTFPTAKLPEAWSTLFADSAPNGVLVVRDPSGAASSFVLTLSDPRVDGSTMTFSAAVVQGKDHSSELPGMTQVPSTPPPTTFGAVSLFIDNASPADGTFKCLNGNGQVISPPGSVPAVYKPMAPWVKLCSDAGGTVSPQPPS